MSEFQNETIVVENGILDEQLSKWQTLVVIQQLGHKERMWIGKRNQQCASIEKPERCESLMSESRSENDGDNALSIVQLLTEHETLNIVE